MSRSIVSELIGGEVTAQKPRPISKGRMWILPNRQAGRPDGVAGLPRRAGRGIIGYRPIGKGRHLIVAGVFSGSFDVPGLV